MKNQENSHCRPPKGDNMAPHCHSSDKDCWPQGQPEASDMETGEKLGSSCSCQSPVEAMGSPFLRCHLPGLWLTLPKICLCQAGT